MESAQRTVIKRKTPKSNGWTPQRRKAQSARVRAQKIWLQSTGPRSVAGKARSAANSLKHGCHTQDRRIRQRFVFLALNAQKRFHHNVMLFRRLPQSLPDYAARESALNAEGDRMTDWLCAALLLVVSDDAEI